MDSQKALRFGICGKNCMRQNELDYALETCPPQKYGLRSPSSFCETVTIVQTAQIENSSAEMIRYYLSLIPEAFKFVWAHVNVAENTPQSSNFERTVAMHWN
jgi:hypothetical protein